MLFSLQRSSILSMPAKGSHRVFHESGQSLPLADDGNGVFPDRPSLVEDDFSSSVWLSDKLVPWKLSSRKSITTTHRANICWPGPMRTSASRGSATERSAVRA